MKKFDSLFETLLTELAPADFLGDVGETVSDVNKKVSDLPGKSQHWSPLQKLDPEIREKIVTAIIKKVFPDNEENTYSLTIDNIEDLRNTIQIAIKEVAADNPEFKASSKWAAKFLADRLANKELFGNVKYTTTDGEKAVKRDVTQKEVRKALNKALEEKPREENDAMYYRAADIDSEDTELHKAFNKLPENDNFTWQEMIDKIGEENAEALKSSGAVIEIIGDGDDEEDSDEPKDSPIVDASDDEEDDVDFDSYYNQINDRSSTKDFSDNLNDNDGIY